MDEDTAELIAQLCTRMGMIMEDNSLTALTIGRIEPAARDAAIQQLDTAAAQISVLVQAAKALMLSQYCPRRSETVGRCVHVYSPRDL